MNFLSIKQICDKMIFNFNNFIMATVTYQTLQTESLINVSFQSISTNFKTIDTFIKNFPQFQRKLTQLEKMQKATASDLSNFKISTQNTFSTINDMMDNRGSGGKGSSLADAEEIKEIKKSFKDIKNFITENTREQHQAQQTRDQQAEQINRKVQEQIVQVKKDLEHKQHKIDNLQEENSNFKFKYSTKVEMQGASKNQNQTNQKLESATQKVDDLVDMMERLQVKEMRETIDTFQNSMSEDFNEMKRKFKLKADYSDVIKLEEMLLNIISFSYENSAKKFADKVQTKKALVFMQKKLNKVIQNVFGDDEDRQGLLTTKGLKCISCTKDLGDMQGKLDKYKAWSVFPAKDPQIKDRYTGFGAGFQTIVETTVNKKGGDISYDEKGRMTTPYNLTREVQGNLLKPSQSQSKLGKDNSTVKYQSTGAKGGSPGKMQLQTNYMSNFGRSSDPDIDLKSQYMEKERGLMSYIKYIMDGHQQDKSSRNK